MSKKLMVLAAGVLTALAFSALPSVASAGEFIATCSTGGTCTGTVQGTGNARLEAANGLAITCTATTGTSSQNNNSSTGSVKLTFTGCTENIFGSKCQSGATGGQIVTNTMISHLVYLEPDHSVKGVLLTGANVTFNCFFGSVLQTVTGNIIGEIENPECGIARTHHTIQFTLNANGEQRWTQVTTAGIEYGLEVNGDEPAEPYEEATQTGTGHINYAAGTTVTLDC